jgi:hypothetical protein
VSGAESRKQKAESNDEPTVEATLAVASNEQEKTEKEEPENGAAQIPSPLAEKVAAGGTNTDNLQDTNRHLMTEEVNNIEPHWHTMFQQVFASVPTIYYPLKETLPQIENNIIKVTVKNDIQKEHFEAKKREVLEYLRTHCDEKIEDVEVTTNEKMETKKIIYDVKDKLQNFKEQNEEFEDFLQILDLKIKD